MKSKIVFKLFSFESPVEAHLATCNSVCTSFGCVYTGHWKLILPIKYWNFTPFFMFFSVPDSADYYFCSPIFDSISFTGVLDLYSKWNHFKHRSISFRMKFYSMKIVFFLFFLMFAICFAIAILPTPFIRIGCAIFYLCACVCGWTGLRVNFHSLCGLTGRKLIDKRC